MTSPGPPLVSSPADTNVDGTAAQPVLPARRRWPAWPFLILIGAALLALGFWAGRVALLPPQDPTASAGQPITYTVLEQTIERSLAFTAVAEWETVPLAGASSTGLLTSIDVASGDVVEPGDVLYTINLRPVVGATGLVPAFRDLALGDNGADVRQLQELLIEVGFLDSAPDGQFDERTEAAVRAWQASLGIDDGVVRLGDVLFTAELPIRVIPTGEVAIGEPVTGGEAVIAALAPEPTVVIPLTREQRDLVPLSGEVVVTHPGGSWSGVIARAAEPDTEGGLLDLVLEGVDGGPICGDACVDAIPPEGRTDFEAEIVVVPPTTGPVVPIAAISTDPGGNQSVQLVSGEVRPIDIHASTDGLAVVTGIDAGDVIVLPFSAPPPSS